MASLPFTAAACKLAQAIFHARSEAYGIPIPQWDTLDPKVRAQYVEEARLTLEAVHCLPPYAESSAFSEFLMDVAASAFQPAKVVSIKR